MRTQVLKTSRLALLLAGLACLSFVSGQETKAPATESLPSLRARAERGDARAQLYVGIMYFEGRGVPQDYAEAVRWYRKAADQGEATAQGYLGIMYEQGRGVAQDYAEAVRWYLKAAEQGNAFGQFSLGLRYAMGRGVPRDYVEAVRWYRMAAEQGDADAQFNLGVMYEEARGVLRDVVEAHKWYNLAASRATGDDEYKFAAARNEVARQMTAEQIADAQRWARGWDKEIGRNPASESLRSVQARADRGDATAQNDLGFVYEMGFEVPQDYVEAHMWLNLAASRANGKLRESVVFHRDGLAGKMTSGQIAEAQRRAREWKPKSSENTGGRATK